VRVIRVRARNPFGRTKISGIDFVVNQYIGCIHGCKYCYAKFMCRWYGEWGKWVIVRENLPELIRDRFVSGSVLMSSISDPYQPIEGKLELTRKVLKAMNQKIRLKILTKSDLILRDVDLLEEFRRLEVGLTVNSFDEELRKIIEPKAPSMERRFKALERLHDHGIKTYSFIAPVIPKITDLNYVIERTKDHVEYYIVELLNLKTSGNFRSWLKKNYPSSYYGLKMDVGGYAKKIQKILAEHSVLGRVIVHPQ